MDLLLLSNILVENGDAFRKQILETSFEQELFFLSLCVPLVMEAFIDAQIDGPPYWKTCPDELHIFPFL